MFLAETGVGLFVSFKISPQKFLPLLFPFLGCVFVTDGKHLWIRGGVIQSHLGFMREGFAPLPFNMEHHGNQKARNLANGYHVTTRCERVESC